MKNKNRPLKLLPFYFQSVGLLFLLALLLLVLFNAESWHNFQELEKYRSYYEIGIVLSLLIIATSKDRIEDERTLVMRLQAYYLALIFGVVLFIINRLLFPEYEKMSSFLLITMMFVIFIVVLWLKKRYSE